ncbi:peptidase family C50-domain-containing protein [Bombardia bombarda]|uniref:separase n=1 Tax=Bombardia bombarda TaxID=252184 RepID=A0AA39XBG8_9PEZI|nr:peptidase family C50-domain-containing protein [Bombardia bombarda]
MDTPPAQADAVRAAVASVSTCSPATTALLKSLLLPKDDPQPAPTTASSTSSRTTAATKASRSRPNTPANADAKRTKSSSSTAESNNGLSAKEKAALATQVVNATLRALGEAAKPAPPPPTPTKRPTTQEGELVKTAARNTLQRSSSTPMTPLQPRSLNRQSTSPVITRRPRSPSKSGSNATTNLLSTVECARVAFAALRLIQSSDKITLPDLQLESGMSALVGKLIALGLHEQAIRELRVLKKRLESPAVPENNTKKPAKTASAEPKNVTQAFADILDFSGVKATGPALSLIITTQIQALRILSAIRKPAYVEAVVPHLLRERDSSPMNLLMMSAQVKGADVGKIARQMETVAQCLLSLTPNVSTKEDTVGVESRLSISPKSALELQALALETRLHWWKLVKHKGDIEKEIMLPFSRCLGAYVRRGQASGKSTYTACLEFYNRIYQQVQTRETQPSGASKLPLAGIYQTLTTLAREAGQLSDAVSWAAKLRVGLDSKVESVAKTCSVAAQLLSLHLKDPAKYLQDEHLLNEVLAGIQGPLRGDSSELDELLTNVCQVRRSVMSLLLPLSKSDDDSVSESSKELMESFILQCPRFCLRWLGKPPEPKSSTKDYLRYEQRRQLLVQSIQHVFDSALATTKSRMEQNRMTWDAIDSLLVDCTTLLEYVGDLGTPNSPTTYYVKISHFYYLQYSILRQQITDPKDATPLRALRRSVDCVKHRSTAEKEKAQLTLKLERMAELCRNLGRGEQALGALQTIRSSLVEDGVLETVARALTTESPSTAWTRTDKAESLSRTLSSISKMEQVWIDWTVDLSEAEQAAALEHRLRFILLGGGRKHADITLEHPTVDALLRIYIPTRFPIRRLRVLLGLLCSVVGNASEVSELLSIAKDAVQIEENSTLGEDSGLVSFLPHMKAFYNSLTALVDALPNLDALAQSVSIWQSSVKSCQQKSDLDQLVDDVPGLLDHLQSIADFLRMKGQDNMLATVLELAAAVSRVAEGPRPEDVLNHNSSLALQYTNLGQSSKAMEIFLRAQDYVGLHDKMPSDAVACFHLSFTEHYLAVGNLNKAEEHLSQARIARGESHHALSYSRDGVRVLLADWVKLESQLVAKSPAEDSTMEDATFDMSTADTKHDSQEVTPGPEFWRLFPWLFRSILRLSSLYAHLGLFQETMYYAEQAQKIAKTVNCEVSMAECAAWMGSVFLKAANPAKALDMLQEARTLLPDGNGSYTAAELACQIGSLYRDLKNTEGAESMFVKAEAVLENLAATTASVAAPEPSQETAVIEDKMAKLNIDSKPTRVTRRVATKPAPVKKVVAPRKVAAAKTKAVVIPKKVPAVEDAQLSRLRASILIQKAASTLGKKEWSTALAMLKDAVEASKLPGSLPTGQVAMAACLLGMSMEQMARDPVFSVIQDSTISFPAIAGLAVDKNTADRHSPGKTPPTAKKTRGGAAAAAKESPKDMSSRMYVEYMREAQEYLVDAHAVATVSGDAGLVHRISVMLQNVSLLLAATSSRARGVTAHSGHTSYSVELARNLTWRRERKALNQEKNGRKTDGFDWPLALESTNAKRTSLGFCLDLNRFQRDYIDIIPKPWSVISISLSENQHDLCITKLQAGQSPFVIRLPLERASSRDADTAVFNFHQGRAELLEIINLANETCHDARDMTTKGAKSAWWADREALDVRLKELLDSVEQIWLGGFRGIFSQHVRRSDLLAQFQKDFLTVLDKHLPSRRQVRGRKTKMAAQQGSGGVKVTLDQRVLELFIGLGDAAAQGCDFDDELTDLLYFVVDILQFHGERNAYDEIDFDSMVVETFDALHAYHAAVKRRRSCEDEDAGVHTILMLDKSLHVFPWESLPCLQGLAVSRMPSLVCLRRLILEQRAAPVRKTTAAAVEAASSSGEDELSSPATATASTPNPPVRDGHHVSLSSGTIILNPSADLRSTQATFEQPLASHLPSASWKQIVAREPTEAEFETALSDADILLYFGHGSGAQYIRGRTIRRLDRCRAAVLLMGCSSARLADAGEFEVYGPAWNYLMAGCPAVVGTLWDVTDRDIDRFAARLFEEWGLAVAGARGVCRFKYLTAAAVAVYGIPVYVY